ncbi:tigger transposable element-derived protein 6-like, partial [Aphis craccivora]
MPSKYKRTSNQQSWNAVSMKKAIESVKNKKMCYNEAAKYFNVPRTTLIRRVRDVNIDATGNKKILGRFRSVFTNDQEQEIVNYLIDMEKRFYGLTINNIQTLAFELAEKNNISHNFSVTKKMAGKDWVKGFRKRHPEITLRSPEATSSARAQAFNRPNVMKFFTILQNVQQKNSFLPH